MIVLEKKDIKKLLVDELSSSYTYYRQTLIKVITEIVKCSPNLRRYSKVVDNSVMEENYKVLSKLIELSPNSTSKIKGKEYDIRNNLELVYNDNNEWMQINKLNSNKYDSIEFISDVLIDSPIFNIDIMIEKISNKDHGYVKNSIKKLVTNKKNIFNTYLINPDKYLTYSTINSIDGGRVEDMVDKNYSNLYWEIYFRGGDGNPIDMLLGIDMIINKGELYKIIQVKSAVIDEVTIGDKEYYQINRKLDEDIPPIITHLVFGDLKGVVVEIDNKDGFYVISHNELCFNVGFPNKDLYIPIYVPKNK